MEGGGIPVLCCAERRMASRIHNRINTNGIVIITAGSSVPVGAGAGNGVGTKALRGAHRRLSKKLNGNGVFAGRRVVVCNAAAVSTRVDPKQRIVITGQGICSAFGNDVDVFYEQ